ncbi:MAG: hypothetical protein J1F20_00015 [Muribaculaceae bacterium]|nr:hypothetical protein [Muribaculaceae bacterium]
MSNKAKRNLFLALLILDVVAYVGLMFLFSLISPGVKWWISIVVALLFIFCLAGYRNFSQAVKEDNKYGPM